MAAAARIQCVDFSIRFYRSEDFQTLWGIDQDCFPRDIAYTQYELRSYMGRRGAFTLVAESATEGILGFVVAECRRRAGHIITIDVQSLARRRKVGSGLLNGAESEMRSAGCDWVRLETAVDNGSALAFYKRHGYDVIQTIARYYSNGVDALLLEKQLSAVEVGTPDLAER
jgi:ribosomal-protein-alanine N-acetyltransferase